MTDSQLPRGVLRARGRARRHECAAAQLGPWRLSLQARTRTLPTHLAPLQLMAGDGDMSRIETTYRTPCCGAVRGSYLGQVFLVVTKALSACKARQPPDALQFIALELRRQAPHTTAA